jgi:predicted RNA-binding Zn ribbon-like protein
MAFLDLIRADAGWLRICAAEDCEDVLVDHQELIEALLRYGNCGNRTNVAAYRARKRLLSA